MAGQVRVLTLEDGGSYEHILHRVQKGWTIRFSLGTSFWYRNVELFCNYPLDEADKFERSTYNLYEWMRSDKSNDFTCANIKIKKAGVYQFYVVTNDNGVRKTCCNGSFLVDPTLSVGSHDLPMDSIVMQTVLCKLLGPFPTWKKRLSIAPECGYNVFHFSPLQELGESNSSYSIKDHHTLNPVFSTDKQVFDLEKMANFVEKVHTSWGMLSIIDVVWNHAANDSEWLQKHPEAGYNLQNSPHMRPAFLVDRALWYLNKDIMDEKYVSKGVERVISNEGQLHCLSQIIRDVLHEIHLNEFFILDVQVAVDQFRNMFKASGYPKKKPSRPGNYNLDDLVIVQDEKFTRLGCSVDLKFAVKSCFKYWDEKFSYEENMDKLCNLFRAKVMKLNEEKERYIEDLHEKIIYNIIGHAKYHFLDPSGPKYSTVTDLHSISVRYFSYPFPDSSYKDDCELMESSNSCYIMAHNGWVMGFDAMKNFAESDSMVYLNRELIAWGDSIKLRYGNGPEDSPFLYEYMQKYTEEMARVFHGFRIDNCHSTPIHVAEYLLDCAREIRPDLYVMAELFTNNEATDNTFINRLGINSLIRENLGAGNSRDLGRHVHRYGGDAVGSFIHPPVQPLKESMSHAIFMDLTHDNPSLFQARSVFDIIPSSALVSATSSGIGSTRGYDELVPHHIHVVHEERFYKSYSSNKGTDDGVLTKEDGILTCKEALNILHVSLDEGGYSQIYVDQMTEDICSVTRHNPETHDSVIVVAYNAFHKPDASCYPSVNNNSTFHTYVPPVKVPGVLSEIVIEARLLERDENYVFEKDENCINGNTNYLVEMREHIQMEDSKFCKMSANNNEIEFTNFIPGSIVAFKISLQPSMKKAVQSLRHVLSTFPSFGYKYTDKADSNVSLITPFSNIVKDLSLDDLNRILYRCGEEEKNEGWGGGCYNIPGHGDLVYCGLQGIMSVLSTVHVNNDLGHSICNNLRQGNWLLDYTSKRLKVHQGTFAMGMWFESVFAFIAELPRYLVPCYFDAVVTCAYTQCLDKSFSLMSSAVQNGTSLFKHLSLGSLQVIGRGTNSLPPAVKQGSDELVLSNSSMAAGLPHFSVGSMRCWGRDTFISLRGLLLTTGRFDLARNIILSFAGCVRHGLIPNLLDDGVHARYNSRDATWFWLQAVQDYCTMSEEGTAFLSAAVIRMYPTNSSIAQLENAPRMELQDVIQEILMTHFQGLSFQERNAGPDLDRDMSSEGFWQSIGVDMETGFVFGGNENNCGTWMDKMGSSSRSQNKGHPSSPRDGSAVEIVGLSKSALRWLIERHDVGDYRYSAVSRTDKEGVVTTWSYKEWDEKIEANFENKYFISKDSSEDMVHKREIYKDTFKSFAMFTDYQLRPNFPIAMCVAPELFLPENALAALLNVEKHLLGPLGLKTLDPDDQRYDGYYENNIDCDNFHKAKGFNYHQGPEWVWVLGPYLRAKIYFSQLVLEKKEFLELLKDIKRLLLVHYRHLMSSPWRGIPELTNKDGEPCHDSCPTQAWSSACLLEVLQYINECDAA